MLHRFILLSFLVAICVHGRAQVPEREQRVLAGASAVPILNIQVQDDGGAPLPDAIVMVYLPRMGWSYRKTDVAGWVSFRPLEVPAFIEMDLSVPRKVMAMAPSFAPAGKDVNVSFTGTTETLRLSRGNMVELRLLDSDGDPMPDETTIIGFTQLFKGAAMNSLYRKNNPGEDHSAAFNLTPMEAAGSGIFIFHWDDANNDPLYMIVDLPGKIRYALAGPFMPDDLRRGQILAVTPRPGALYAEFKAPELEKVAPPFNLMNLQISKLVQTSAADARQIEPFLIFSSQDTELNLELTDLAPGDYHIDAFTGPLEKRTEQFRPAAFNERKRAALASGETRSVDFKYKETFNPYAGEYSVDVQILSSNGLPAANVDWAVSGANLRTAAVIARGKTDQQGFAKLTNLGGGEDAPIYYHFYVLNMRLGTVPVGGEKKHGSMILKIPPVAGDIAPSVQFVELNSTETLKLDDYLGQIVLVEFWASWCGPCQEPMAKNNELMKRRGEEWKGKAAIISVATDDSIEVSRRHVAARDWNYTDNAWAGPPELELGKSRAEHEWGVFTIPEVMVLDRTGRIAWRGHPGRLNVESVIEEMVKAEM